MIIIITMIAISISNSNSLLLLYVKCAYIIAVYMCGCATASDQYFAGSRAENFCGAPNDVFGNIKHEVGKH